jgi:hypothetical protein
MVVSDDCISVGIVDGIINSVTPDSVETSAMLHAVKQNKQHIEINLI